MILENSLKSLTLCAKLVNPYFMNIRLLFIFSFLGIALSFPLCAQQNGDIYQYNLILQNKKTLRGNLDPKGKIIVLDKDSAARWGYAIEEIEYFTFNKYSHIGRYLIPSISINTYAFSGSGSYVDLSGSGINLGLNYLFQFSNTWGVNTGLLIEYYNRNFFGNWEEFPDGWRRTITNEGEMFIFNLPLHFALLTGESMNPNFYLHLGADVGIFHFRRKLERIDNFSNMVESVNVRRTGLNINFLDIGIGARIPLNRNYAILLNNRTSFGLLSYPGGVGASAQTGFALSLMAKLKNLPNY
jgi:hypothetical protein